MVVIRCYQLQQFHHFKLQISLYLSLCYLLSLWAMPMMTFNCTNIHTYTRRAKSFNGGKFLSSPQDIILCPIVFLHAQRTPRMSIICNNFATTVLFFSSTSNSPKMSTRFSFSLFLFIFSCAVLFFCFIRMRKMMYDCKMHCRVKLKLVEGVEIGWGEKFLPCC